MKSRQESAFVNYWVIFFYIQKGASYKNARVLKTWWMGSCLPECYGSPALGSRSSACCMRKYDTWGGDHPLFNVLFTTSTCISFILWENEPILADGGLWKYYIHSFSWWDFNHFINALKHIIPQILTIRLMDSLVALHDNITAERSLFIGSEKCWNDIICSRPKE